VSALTLRPAEELRPSSRLHALLPAIYRQRDAVLSGIGQPGLPPLAALARVVGTALDDLYDAVSRLWDDHFVERAEAEALPLLAELVGARLLSSDPRAQRALVARIVGWRRRKGTLLTLEEVLTETSTWDAEVDEGFRSVLATLDFAHLAPWRGRSAILWDPIGLSDPLTRRSPGESRPRNDTRRERRQLLAPQPGEELDDTLRRLGRVDAGMYAASPRTLDLRDWARPDAVLVRSSRLVPVELEDVEPLEIASLADGQRRALVDAAGADTPLVWLAPVGRPDLTGGLTERHEPAAEEEPVRLAAGLLTPTALAEDPDRALQARAFEVAINGVPLLAPPTPRTAYGALRAQSIGRDAILRFAEDARPSPGDIWSVQVVAALPEQQDVTDRLQMTAELGEAGPRTPTRVEESAGEEIAGRTIDLVIKRLAGQARRRAADGTWSALDVEASLDPPESNAATVVVGAQTWVARIERNVAAATNRLNRFVVRDGTWTTVRVLPPPLEDASGIGLIGEGDALFAVAADDETLAAFRIDNLAGAAAVMRLDAGGGAAPLARKSPSLCVADGRLYVFGGDRRGAATGDMWSLPLAGGPWQPHMLRRQEERMGAAVVATPAGLAVIGGDPVPGAMTSSCRLWSIATSRTWRALPSLPFPDGRPGLLIARATGGDIEVVAWADRTRPVHYVLPAGADAWQAGALEAAGPNPPDAGEALFVGNELLVIAPSPLPASDLVFTQGAEGVLASLPRLPMRVDEERRLRVASDGARFSALPPDAAREKRPRPLDARFGGLLGDEFLQAASSGGRYAQPGRLSPEPWRLAQRSLGPWARLVARSPDEQGTVFLDPRLGRFVLPPEAPRGRVTVSCRIGRGGLIGPGLMRPDRSIPDHWREPDLTLPTPPDIEERPGRAVERDPHAYLAPHRAGQLVNGPQGASVRVVADLEAAVERAAPELPRIAVLGSARVPFARLTTGVDRGFSMVAADAASIPVLGRDDERDLSLLLQTSADAPEFWLAGLRLLGRLELAIERGTADLRHCQLAAPGRVSLWAPGAGHQGPEARRSLPSAELEVRLYGCQLGVVELPPWASLVAAGCTFDAGARDAVAIRAAGAAVRLRHCTVHGRVEAGSVKASSCAFAGEIRVDRDDLGFIRHSLLARGGRTPRPYASLVHTVSLVSLDAASPAYLVLAENNGPGALAVGEGPATPGAYGERGDHERELLARSGEFLPIGMAPVHVDRTVFDLYRMARP
jgi:hypothetical protein